MTHHVKPGHAVLSDSQPLVWLLAGIFGIVGFAFLGLAAQETARGKVGLPVAGDLAAGLIGVGCALYAAQQAERLVLDIDKWHRRVVLSGRLLWRRRERTWSFSEIADVEIEEDKDSEGEHVWRAVLVLKSGERVPLMANWRHDREHCERYRDDARRALGR
jgi:hypothetical protein